MGIIQISGHTLHPRFLDGNSIVFDLGANHGSFTRSVSERFHCRCVAVEPNAALLKEIRAIPRVDVIRAAIGATDGFTELQVAINDQASTVMNSQEADVVRRESVPMLSLESLFRKFDSARMDLVKMDIEGAEVMSLDACSDNLLRRIGQFALEFHDAQGLVTQDEIERIAGRLTSLGFYWVRGTFTNYEDNLFINRELCPLTQLELLTNRTVFRVWNGVRRVIRRQTAPWH